MYNKIDYNVLTCSSSDTSEKMSFTRLSINVTIVGIVKKSYKQLKNSYKFHH
jgi:hypothetical protein